MQTAAISSSELSADFLTLLVTQLQNQDPIEPVDQENFISQLAQFSTVEGIENLNVKFEDILHSQQVLSGFNLAGKEVSYLHPDSTEPRRGTVSEVFLDSGRINAMIDGIGYPVSQIVGVFGDQAAK